MSEFSNFHVVLLAAGLSSRMGAVNKLMISFGDQPLIRRSADLYCSLGMNVIVVLGHEAEAVKSALDGLPLKTVFNPSYKTGQQSSVHIGLKKTNLIGDGLLMALADQPLLTHEDIANYCRAFYAGGATKIMVPYFGERRGNPVLFPLKIALKIQADDKMIGCRDFIDLNPHLVRRYKDASEGFVSDMDKLEQVEDHLSRFRERL